MKYYAYGWKYHPTVGGFLGLGLNAGTLQITPIITYFINLTTRRDALIH